MNERGANLMTNIGRARPGRIIWTALALGAAVLALAALVPAASFAQAADQVPVARSDAQSVATVGGAPSQPATAASGVPRCPAGQLPHLEIATFPASDRGGAATPEAAVRAVRPNAGALLASAMGA